ncbi:Lrp/AsnC family transcriptional regulator [Streptomyces cavernicola]|uniref:Lrp/AsnC family transcriptional regulator n=1 Tax=Streptomyces cavernicola TaxID=3043613 RepID=A0ABT6S534_9ACTN|nr:Lrp/AsnC family transcriptional regulator [Streptomyces sp. B-S-A6]MDI3403195.1 Lrp/AsnC family transcriptional regulator [Streptomyces sp. B-S-A6]
MLDEKDLVLVHALQEAPRASWAVLASVLGTDARTLVRRYARLRDVGLLRVMATSGPRLLERQLFAHLRLRTGPGRVAPVAEELARWPQASTIRLTDGSTQIYALLVGSDHTRLVETAQQRVAELPDVREAEINTVLLAGDVGRAARLDALSPQQIGRLRGQQTVGEGQSTQPVRLSAEDFELIRLLLEDGRTEISELAARLGREASSVSRRVARLRNDGWLDIITLVPDRAWSSPLRALLWCTVAPQDVDALLRTVSGRPWVGSLTVTTGRANVLVTVNLMTRSQLPGIQAELSTLCPSLRLLEAQLSVRAVKLHMRLLAAGDRLSDPVSDPFWDIRHDFLP